MREDLEHLVKGDQNQIKRKVKTMFGKKKKEEVVNTPVVPAAPEATLDDERECPRCGAMAKRTESGNFRCMYCSAVFSDAQADKAEAGQEAAKQKTFAILAEKNAKENNAPVNAPSNAPKSNPATSEEAARNNPIRVSFKGAPVTNEMSSEDIYSYNCNGVVEIITDFGRASGLIISKKGFVLTNAHAVLNMNEEIAEDIYVKFKDEVIRAYPVAIGNTDSNDPNSVDLALLVMESVPALARSLKLGRSDTARIGQHVYYIGNSKGEGLCMTAGIISDNNRKVGERTFIMTDAATNPGNSGGPLFNDDGYVIGVHVSARNEAVGMKYAIPVNTARLFLNVIEDQLEIQRDVIADNLVPMEESETSNESLSATAIITLVLSGIAVLTKGLDFAKQLLEAFGK